MLNWPSGPAACGFTTDPAPGKAPKPEPKLLNCPSGPAACGFTTEPAPGKAPKPEPGVVVPEAEGATTAIKPLKIDAPFSSALAPAEANLSGMLVIPEKGVFNPLAPAKGPAPVIRFAPGNGPIPGPTPGKVPAIIPEFPNASVPAIDPDTGEAGMIGPEFGVLPAIALASASIPTMSAGRAEALNKILPLRLKFIGYGLDNSQ